MDRGDLEQGEISYLTECPKCGDNIYKVTCPHCDHQDTITEEDLIFQGEFDHYPVYQCECNNIYKVHFDE